MPGFREFIIEPSRARILAFIAISYIGMPGLNYDEYANIESCNLEVLERAVNANRDIVVGIKVRMGTGRAAAPASSPAPRPAGGR